MSRPWPLPLAAAAFAVLSGCAGERKPQPIAAPPAPQASIPAQPALPAPPLKEDWRDAEATPGSWSYRGDANASEAVYRTPAGAVLAGLRCQRGADSITVHRAGAAAGPVPLTITTTSTSRSFTAVPASSSAQELALGIAARDPIFDAMAFSRGRFMIEVPGLPALYLPAWPEVGRVVEDCR